MRILITGIGGFIGSHLGERLAGRGDVVVGLDNFDPFYPRQTKERNLEGLRANPRFIFVAGDIRSHEDLDRAFHVAGPVDIVVHLAALAGVRPSLREPERFYEVNVLGTARLYEACRRAGVRRVVFASSSSVYGANSKTPFAESDECCQPLSPYAASKRAGELIGWTAHHLESWSITCLRFFTVYGPRQRPDLAIHKFTDRLSRGVPIELYGDGTTARDYTYVDDIIDGVVAAIDQIHEEGPPRFRTYNLSGRRSTSLATLVEILARRLNVTPEIVRLPEQPGDMTQTLADLALAAAELGYFPGVSLEEGLARFLAWWRADAKAAGMGKRGEREVRKDFGADAMVTR